MDAYLSWQIMHRNACRSSSSPLEWAATLKESCDLIFEPRLFLFTRPLLCVKARFRASRWSRDALYPDDQPYIRALLSILAMTCRTLHARSVFPATAFLQTLNPTCFPSSLAVRDPTTTSPRSMIRIFLTGALTRHEARHNESR